MNTALDFAAQLISPDAIAAAGHSAVLCYVSSSRPGSNFGAKPVTRDYVRSLKAAGLDVVSIWQYGKPGNPSAPSDWTIGYEGGQRMAQLALDKHLELGGPAHAPIYFAVDEDISLTEWNRTAVGFFKGVNSVLGRANTGIYGHSRVCAWAIEDDVIGGRGGYRWAWQTRAWSNGAREPQAVLYQRVIDTPSSPGPLVDGAHVDVNDILAPEFGQWSMSKTAPVPTFRRLDRIGGSHSPRHGARISNFLLHTQEGDGTASSLARYLNDPSHGASYHYVVANREVAEVVPLHRASWSVLDANPSTVNLCFAGSRAAWTRDQWLAIRDDLEIAAYLAVQTARSQGFSAGVISPPYRHSDGISDHAYITWRGIGTHTDVGPNFPWDVFAKMVAKARGRQSEPAEEERSNAIDDYREANPWLGDRTHEGEHSTPDGIGRFAQFDGGFVYWSPETGAHAVPLELWSAYTELEWEQGPLGYPVTDHTEAHGGYIQGFQGGALYRRGTNPAHPVWGEIRARYLQLDAEKGALGWPITHEIPHDGGAYQKFENGQIVWPGQNSTVTLMSTEGTDEIR